MRDFFFGSLRLRLIALCITFVAVPTLLFAYFGTELAKDVVYYGMEQRLKETAQILDSFLPEKGFDRIINQYGVQYGTRQEQIEALNAALTPITENIVSASPGVAVGYYSAQLNAIITYGPEKEFGHMVGLTPRANHPKFQPLKELRPATFTETLAPGHVMDVVVPIIRKGKAIGLVWANESSENYKEQLAKVYKNLAIIVLIGIATSIIAIVFLYFKFFQGVLCFTQDVKRMHTDTTVRIPNLKGMFSTLGKSCNSLSQNLNTTENRLQATKALLDDVLQNSSAAILICDPSTMTLAYVNPCAMNLWNLDNFDEKPCYEILHGRNIPCQTCPHGELFTPNMDVSNSVQSHKIFYKELQRDFLVHDSIVHWEKGKFFHMRLATDITTYNERTALENSLKTNRFFLARTNHEMRIPIHNMLETVRIALKNEPSRAQENFLKKIQKAAHQLLSTTHTISDYSYLEAETVNIEEKLFDLHGFLYALEDDIYRLFGSDKILLQLTIDESVPKYMLGDSFRLGQVVLYIVNNVIRNTQKDYISIEVSARELYNETSHLRFVIKDSNLGLGETDLEKFFEEYGQEDNSSKGPNSNTGIGISIVKTLVQLMGGEITLESKKGIGSTLSFFVELKKIDDTNSMSLHENVVKPFRYT